MGKIKAKTEIHIRMKLVTSEKKTITEPVLVTVNGDELMEATPDDDGYVTFILDKTYLADEAKIKLHKIKNGKPGKTLLKRSLSFT